MELSRVVLCHAGVHWRPGAGADARSVAPGKPEEEIFGQYTPGAGFRVAKTELGELNIQVFTYIRYLNQSSLDPTYYERIRTDELGATAGGPAAQQGADRYVRGWILSPKLRYMA